MTDRLVGVSKLLSLMLRHEPAQFDLLLDAEGFAPLEEVLRALRTRKPEATLDDIRAVIEIVEPDKRRFSIVDDEIRANYGHSLTRKIEHAAQTPPAVLLHGTTVATVDVILRDGLSPMRRQYVHLTTDRALANRVGARRGKPVILQVAALDAHREGTVFHRANEAFWLADHVPAAYLRRSD